MGVPEKLVIRSTITEKQLESLQSYIKVIRGELRLREAAAQRTDREVTIGSYYRTVQQARAKIKGSMASVLIGLWLGLVKVDEVRRLFDLVSRGAGGLSEEDEERFVQVIDALIDKLVM